MRKKFIESLLSNDVWNAPYAPYNFRRPFWSHLRRSRQFFFVICEKNLFFKIVNLKMNISFDYSNKIVISTMHHYDERNEEVLVMKTLDNLTSC